MLQERWLQIEDLFHAALAQSPSGREQFLQQRCGPDTALKHSVLSLLAHYQSADGQSTDLPATLAGTAPSLVIDQMIDHFQVIKKLGSGGMGTVWLAEDTRLARQVALKLLHQKTGEASELRFLQEARMASALRHPNVVTIYDIGNFDGWAYIASEYVDGGTLTSILSSGPLTLSETSTFISPLLSVLRQAHAIGIVHRDLKPDNILIGKDGAVKLTDFGLAKFFEKALTLRPAESLTQSGFLVGTPGYMSPEQARAEPVDHRTDIWSLGVIIYEMTVGRKPFVGPSLAHVLWAIQEQPISDDLERLVEPHLAHIIRRALTKDKHNRYSSIAELEADWKRLNTGMPVQLVRRGTGRRRVPRLAAVSALLLPLLATAIWLWWKYHQPPPPSFTPTVMTRLTSAGDVADAAISPDGKFFAYIRQESGKQSLCIRQIDADEEHQLLPPAAIEFSGLTFSPDGSFLYYVQNDLSDFRSLYRISELGGEPKHILSDVDSAIGFSPDGRRFAFVRNIPAKAESVLIAADTDGASERALATLHAPEAFLNRGLDWTADGKSLLCPVARPKGDCWVARIFPSGVIEYQLPFARSWMGRIARLGKSDQFALSAGNGDAVAQIFTLDLRGKQVTQITNGPGRYPTVTAAADGSRLLTVVKDRVSGIWITDPEKEAVRITSSSGRYYGVSWTPDDHLLTQGDFSSMMRVLQMNLDGKREHSVLQSDSLISDPRMSPDGRYLVFSSNRDENWHIWRSDLDGLHQKQLTFGSRDDLNPDWSPDGQWVFYSTTYSGGQFIEKISVEGGQPVSVSHTLQCRKPAVSDDGQKLACECHHPGEQWQLGWMETSTGIFHSARKRGTRSVPLRWIPGQNAVSFVSTKDGISNLIALQFDSNQERAITSFTDERIFEFDWDHSGKRIALVRGRLLSEAALLPGVR